MSKESLNLFNIELNWAHLGHPSTQGDYASGKYEVAVVMNAEQAAQVKALINPRQKIKQLDSGKYSLTVKSQMEPPVKNDKGIYMTAEEKDTIGNGTTANIKLNIFEVRGAKFAGIGGIRILELNKYTKNALADLEPADDSAPFTLEDDI